jgi:hypothetical protein
LSIRPRVKPDAGRRRRDAAHLEVLGGDQLLWGDIWVLYAMLLVAGDGKAEIGVHWTRT